MLEDTLDTNKIEIIITDSQKSLTLKTVKATQFILITIRKLLYQMRMLPDDIHNQLIIKILILEMKRKNSIMLTEKTLLQPFTEITISISITIMKLHIKILLIGNLQFQEWMNNKLETMIMVSKLLQLLMIRVETKGSWLIHLHLQFQDMRLKETKFQLRLVQMVFQLMFEKKCHLINMNIYLMLKWHHSQSK